MTKRRIRKTFTVSQDNIEVLDKLCQRHSISESEAVNQIIARYAAENGMSARPRNEGGIFQTKKELPSTPTSVSQDTMPSVDELAPIMRDERFIYDDIIEMKLALHKIQKIVSVLEDNTNVMLNADNSLLHFLCNANEQYFSAQNEPHGFIVEGRAEVAEEKRKAQMNKTYKE